MLKLYQFSACPFCWKVRVLLDYKGIPYETVEVHPYTKKELEFTDYKKVPVLVDGESVITKSADIMNHLNEKHAISLADSDNDRWCTWVDDTLVHYFPPIIHKDFKTSFKTIKEITPPGQSGWLKQLFTQTVGAAIMSKVAKKKAIKLGIIDPVAELKQAVEKWVAEGLNGKPFLGGNLPSVADLSVFGVFRSAEQLNVVTIACNHKSEFATWYAQCKELTAHQMPEIAC
jgi:microsomal prostaglandin-E synthase 2